jgi:hypothetical protein
MIQSVLALSLIEFVIGKSILPILVHFTHPEHERIGFLSALERTENMTKIALIGAGSTVFAKNLMGDILSYPELADNTISLMDIDPNRLRTSEGVAHTIIQALGANATIEATTDRRAALDGADYAICMIQVGGYKPATVIDFEIPNGRSMP